MRISDAERSRAVEDLRRHCIAGRLDLDAYADRIGEAMEAETLVQLEHALRDLPPLGAEPSPGVSQSDNGWHRSRSEAAGGAAGRDPAGSRGRRIWARFVLLLSVLVVAAGVSFLVVAHWIWAGILVAGWIAGVLQGRVRLGRHRRV